MSPRGLSTLAKTVCLSAFPSLFVSTSLTISPRFDFLPSEPCLSTPTKTSPVGAAQMTAGHGVMSGPAKMLVSRSEGTVVLPAKPMPTSRVDTNEQMEKFFMKLILR